jgi:prolyl-tRNA synthetase
MTRPFLRGREFYWIEAHDVFATLEEAEAQVLEDLEITRKVVTERLGIPFITFKRPQWDKFAGAVYSAAADTLLPDGRLLQLPSTHMLGDNFSRAFDIKYVDEEEKAQYAYQTCFGPPISRLYGALAIIHGDDDGLIMPFELAPIQVVIIPIPKKGAKKAVEDKCRQIEKKLRKADFRVHFDNSDKRPGDKYYYWEMRGVPIRLEIGNLEVQKNFATLFRRDLRTREKILLRDLSKAVRKIGLSVTDELRNRANKQFEDAIQDANTFEEICKVVESKRIARINFCTLELEGESCAEKIKDATGAEVRGMKLGEAETPWGPCPLCGEPATVVTYVGRAY